MKHRDFDDEDTYYASHTDAFQEFISTLAQNFRLTRLNDTTVRVAAGAGSDQVAIGIEGRWRYRTTNADVAVTGSAEVKDVWAVAVTENDFVGAGNDPDETDYNFALRVTATGVPPSSVAAYRKVGEVDWDGDSIEGLRQTVNVVNGQQLATDAIEVGAGITRTRQADGGILLSFSADMATQAELDVVSGVASGAAAAAAAAGGVASAHIADSSAAHAASAISYGGGTGMSATDLEAAVDELATEKQDASTAATDTELAAVKAAAVGEWKGLLNGQAKTFAISGTTFYWGSTQWSTSLVTSGVVPFYFNPANYALSGHDLKLRLVVTLFPYAAAGTGVPDATFSLAAISPNAGSGGANSDIGSTVTGSSVTKSTTTFTPVEAVTAELAAPAAGLYIPRAVFATSLGNGTIAGWSLEYRHVLP